MVLNVFAQEVNQATVLADAAIVELIIAKNVKLHNLILVINALLHLI